MIRIIGQISLFDSWIPWEEPEIGEYVKRHGANICHIMRPGYIGQKVIYDCSTQSMELYRCGLLEDYIPYENTFRSIINVGDRQRILLTHYEGREIYECLPWNQYPKRMERIYKHEQR